MCFVQHRHFCASSWHRDGAVGLWGMSDFVDVYAGCYECPMLMLSHSNSRHWHTSCGTHQLWRLWYDTYVCIRGSVSQVCSLPVCDFHCHSQYADAIAATAAAEAFSTTTASATSRLCSTHAVWATESCSGESYDIGWEWQVGQQCGCGHDHG
jgi:hypothetical protein